jgi:hypothetical protein
MWYLYTTEFYSVTKKNEILSFAGQKWMELDNIILSEVSPLQKAKGYIFPLIYVEYRPNTNTCNSMKNRSCQGKVIYKRGSIKDGSL